MVGAAVLLAYIHKLHAATPRTFTATVQRVSDGDTITALTANGTKLRLLGIDAPEIPHGSKRAQPFGEDARDYLDHLIAGRTVQVTTYGPDRWKKRRLPVICDGQPREERGEEYVANYINFRTSYSSG